MTRRDRTGEPIDEDQVLDVDVARHETQCAGGWLPDDAQGRPTPCPVCRPHVAKFRRRVREQLLGRWAS